MQEILSRFEQITPFSAEAKQFITDRILTRFYRKGERPLQAGQICQEVLFVKQGLMKMYFLHQGEEMIGDFFLEGDFAQDMRSNITRQPSRYTIECLEDCELLVIQDSDLAEAYERFPLTFERLSRMITQMNFVMMADRIWANLIHSHEERYLQIQKEKPALLQRIPQYMLASYLGITPVGLSKLRKRLAERS
ncbi:MAG: Crp/Fnr family transcriptional regulator [Bacteroidota bacterium]